MENSAETKKALVYSYLFEYYGSGTYDGKPVLSVDVDLAIRCHKDGTEVKFSEKDGEEPEAGGLELADIFNVSLGGDGIALVGVDTDLMLRFFKKYGWNLIDYEIAGYAFDLDGDEGVDTVDVDKDTFMDFVSKNAGEFDDAQSGGVRYI